MAKHEVCLLRFLWGKRRESIKGSPCHEQVVVLPTWCLQGREDILIFFLCSWPTLNKTSRSSVDDMYTHIVSCVLLKDILRQWKQSCWLLQLVGTLNHSQLDALVTLLPCVVLFFFFAKKKENALQFTKCIQWVERERVNLFRPQGWVFPFLITNTSIIFSSLFCFNFFMRRQDRMKQTEKHVRWQTSVQWLQLIHKTCTCRFTLHCIHAPLPSLLERICFLLRCFFTFMVLGDCKMQCTLRKLSKYFNIRQKSQVNDHNPTVTCISFRCVFAWSWGVFALFGQDILQDTQIWITWCIFRWHVSFQDILKCKRGFATERSSKSRRASNDDYRRSGSPGWTHQRRRISKKMPLTVAKERQIRSNIKSLWSGKFFHLKRRARKTTFWCRFSSSLHLRAKSQRAHHRLQHSNSDDFFDPCAPAERERETDGSDVIIVTLKLAMSYTFPCQKFANCCEFTLSLAKYSHFSFLPLHFLSHHCGAEIRNEFTLSVAKNSLSLFRLSWMARAIENPRQNLIKFCPVLLFFPSKKMNQINTKNYWK